LRRLCTAIQPVQYTLWKNQFMMTSNTMMACHTSTPTTTNTAARMAALRNARATLEHMQLLESQNAQGNGPAVALNSIGGE